MKVVAIDSSPRGDGISKTRMLLDALVRGMRDAGAEVETIQLRQKTVKNCMGCYTCWTKTPGICAHKDDMTNELFPKLLAADVAVFATPLYHYTVNAAMKTFIERTLPIAEPFLYRSEGRTHHPLRQEAPKAVVLSAAGLSEPSVFNQLSSYVNFLFDKKLLAEIYRPAADMMSMPDMTETAKDILEATEHAGRELVQSEKISQNTIQRISQPFGVDLDAFAKMANVFWKSCIAEGLTPKEFQEKGLVPRPDSLEIFMMIMSRGFNPAGAGDAKATLQFDFSGEVQGSCFFRIEDGKIEVREGVSDKPDLTIETPFEVWMDILTGKADGQQMFMQQRFKAVGNLSLLMRMNDFFGKR